MGRHILVLGLGFLALAAFAVGAGWLFFAASEPSPGGWSLGPLWPYALGGLLLLVAIGGFFAWLTSYNARHHYDDRAER